jgi:predicted  nucleic acid-binding Zn-ribbon protein
MKWILALLMMLSGSVVYGQKDSVLTLTKTEVVVLANKIQLLQDSSQYKSSIISAQSRLLMTYNERVSLYDQQLQNRQQTLDLVNKQNEELKKQVESLRPKWYDDNRLWFGAGVVTTVIVFIATR